MSNIPKTDRKDWEPFLADLRAVLSKHSLVLDSHDEYDGHDEWCGTEYAFIDNYGDGSRLPMMDLMSWIHPIIDKRPEIIKRALEGIDKAKPVSEMPAPDTPRYPSKNGGEVID